MLRDEQLKDAVSILLQVIFLCRNYTVMMCFPELASSFVGIIKYYLNIYYSLTIQDIIRAPAKIH